MDHRGRSPSRSSRSSAFGTGRRSSPRCRRGSSRATAGSRAKLVDVAAKEPLRVKEILVDEGALVKPGQVLVRLDTVTLEAELAEAKASIAAAQERLAVAKASIVKQKSEIELAEIEVDRSAKLVEEGAGSQRELDVRKTKLETTKASLGEAKAMLQTAKQRGRGRAGERGDDPDAHRRRDAQVARHRKSPLSPGRSRRGPRARRKGADAGEPGGHLHGDLPPLRSRPPA